MCRIFVRLAGAMALIFAAVLVAFWMPPSSSAQSSPEVYTGMLIASEAVAGSGAGRLNIRIVAYTSEVERNNLKDAFQKSDGQGLALLETMSKGYINVEGQQGRKIYAAFSRPRKDGYELVIVSEHVASKLEQWRGEKTDEHPLAVVHLRLDNGGDPVSGEVYPAVKVSVTPDGFVDVKTNDSNRVTMHDLAKK